MRRKFMLKYLQSAYTKLAFVMALVMYLSYGLPTQSLGNWYLISVSLFVFFIFTVFFKSK